MGRSASVLLQLLAERALCDGLLAQGATVVLLEPGLDARIVEDVFGVARKLDHLFILLKFRKADAASGLKSSVLGVFVCKLGAHESLE